MAELEVICDCGHRFNVPGSLRGGMSNCPSCGKAAAVPGGPEKLFWLVLGFWILLALIVLVPPTVYLFYNGYTLGGWGIIAFACLLVTAIVLSM
jgi:hypothetical protein